MPKILTTPTINCQHEYISINFGNNRRLTTSHSGQKASGSIPVEVFNAFCKAMAAADGGSYGVRIQKFIADIGAIWPDWDKPPRQFKFNEPVNFDFGKRRGGMDKGVVTKVRGTSVTVKWERCGLINMTADMLEEHENKMAT